MSNQIQEESPEGVDPDDPSRFSEVNLLPLIEWSGHQTYIDTCYNDQFFNEQSFIPCPGDISTHGRAFKYQSVSNVSRETKLCDGDILFCEATDYTQESLIPLQLYVVVMQDEFVCRRFFREDRHYEFRSDHPNGCHLIVSSNLIMEVWQVKSILKTRIPAPEALFNEFRANNYKHTVS